MAKDFVAGPGQPIVPPPAGNKGGPGSYNGAGNGSANLPERTAGAGGVPEKTYDKIQGK